jgi:hypothetical protein
MGMTVANFTPDKIRWTHIGISGVLKPGDITEFEENRAKSILNQYDRRGIVQLLFGDDEEKKRAEAMRRYTEFWEHQVIVFNEHNEGMKNQNKPYIKPTRELQEHAAKLGLEIISPWKIKQPEMSADMKELKDENASMKAQMETLMNQVTGLMTLLSKKEAESNEDSKKPKQVNVDWTEARNAYLFKSKAQLKKWVDDMLDVITTWPTHLLDELDGKYMKFYDEHLPIAGFSEVVADDNADIDIGEDDGDVS